MSKLHHWTSIVSSLIPDPRNIAIFHDGPVGFGPDTARHQAIGGTQAATGYLAAALAARGHRVWLFTHRDHPVIEQGVHCLPLRQMSADMLNCLDLVILVQSLKPDLLWSLTHLVPITALCVLWTGQAHDQPDVAALADPAHQGLLDQIWCVSDWQRQGFCRHLGIKPDQTSLLRNAVAPVFEQLAHQDRPAPDKPTRAYYASMPFRGLSVLKDAWAGLTDSGLHLDIFGGMAQYHQADGAYETLYRQVADLPGTTVHGAQPHDVLAAHLAGQDLWLYPSIFAETSCITALEALAVGALPIVSDLGALPETIGDFGLYSHFDPDGSVMAQDFAGCIRDCLKLWRDVDHTARIKRQKQWILQHATWQGRAVMVEHALIQDGRVPV